MTRTVHLCGAGMAFLAFGVSLVIGLTVNNPFVTVVLRAVLMLAAFYVLGCVLAAVGFHAVEENAARQAQSLRDASQAQDAPPPQTTRPKPAGAQSPAP